MISRRTALATLSAAAISASLPVSAQIISKIALKNGLSLPAIGMGTWLTFAIDPSGPEMAVRQQVLSEFFARGGGMIDSSPMYGRSEEVVGLLRDDIMEKSNLFSATKIWTPLSPLGPKQIKNSHRLWKEPKLDLVHVHNLLNYEAHLKTLRAAKDAGTVRYIGLTTSHGRRHNKLESLMKTEDIDAIQLSYNLLNRDAEKRLLPAARDKGLSVIINRPFMTGHLFQRVRGQDVPEWALEEFNTQSWAEYFLKFVISHPAVTCAIPATRNPVHMRENMRAGTGPMPDAKQRLKMIASFEAF